MEDSCAIPNHKLCGFFCTVVKLDRDQDVSSPFPKFLDFGTHVFLFYGVSEVGFRSENGEVLSVISPSVEVESEVFDRGNGKGVRRKRMNGMVNGSMSVVHHLFALSSHKYLKVVARVTENVRHCDGEVLVVILVDVYLPISLWSGWQFPKFASAAAALFRHISCDWKARSSILVRDESHSKFLKNNILNVTNCNVVGCELKCGTSDSSSAKKAFELHEIFKSTPCVSKKTKVTFTSLTPATPSSVTGIWDVSNDVLVKIISSLCPTDLIRVAATCHLLRSLAIPIMPCMNLKLFPHQQKAVEWMLQRERDPELLPHPMYMNFSTEDGFCFAVHSISGEIVIGITPTIRDFRGGLFCDEPGLGKTITALSLILKTLGTMTDPPDGARVTWYEHKTERKCGYYEIDGRSNDGNCASEGNPVRGQPPLHKPRPYSNKRMKLMDCVGKPGSSCSGFGDDALSAASSPCSVAEPSRLDRCSTGGLSHIKRRLFHSAREDLSPHERKMNAPVKAKSRKMRKRTPGTSSFNFSKMGKNIAGNTEHEDNWIQCDSCHKWRKLANINDPDFTTVWFCSMNPDPVYQRCSAPEERWDSHQAITQLQGFHPRGTVGGKTQNVSFFTGILKDHYPSVSYETKKALKWLANLSPEKLSEMETAGLVRPAWDSPVNFQGDTHEHHKLFKEFGLVYRTEKGVTRWYYPSTLSDLVFDLPALRVALSEPLDSFRLYLSRATLIVVPSNLVGHWKTQIGKHIRPCQVRVYLWVDHKKPSAHDLAWDYDIVITTFNRLSVEWGPGKRSALMQVHWLRIILDEGHTLGSSLSLTNKLQMAVSLTASSRWILTGTPTPNTPNNQLSHLQPMLRFLGEEAYGKDQKSWESSIHKPFESRMQEARLRLLQLLHRCMISARKIDLQTIPPCIKKVTFLNFTEEHARSYNELVVTVRRNILMADWNDPSHVESLLNPKQWKFRSTTIRNVRLSCCVAGHIKVTDAGQDIMETMDILVNNGLDNTSTEYSSIKYYLLYGGNCQRCNEWCRLPVITPCRHLLCLDCVALDSQRCMFNGCGNPYEMQTPEILTRPENPNPKWPVPKDLIELQPSYKQDNWDADWQSTSSSKVAYLVHRLKELQEKNREIVHSINSDNSKETNLSEKVIGQKDRSFLQRSVEKVIIFSQFLEHIHIIEQQLTMANIVFAGMYSPMHSIKKMESLALFQHDENYMALLMDGSAALGLDLSFVTHVFLMEPIWDRSIEEQVISRAHRMGATRPVHVETLAMHGTIEEQMLNLLQDAEDCRRSYNEEFLTLDHGSARACRTFHDFAERSYLSQLSFVHTCSDLNPEKLKVNT